jgi:basic membrane lipoprotein Med (substrate-binding protein (PBP1-ABC) superfamily)
MRTLLASLVVVALAVTLAACGSDDDSDSGGSTKASSETSSSGSGGGDKTIKLGAALIGPKNDKSFNEAAYQGILEAQKANPNLKLTATLENKGTDQQRTDAVNTLAPINDVVLGVSASFGPIFDVVADKFPDAYFVNVAGFSAHYHKNVTGFANDWGAPAYVGGVIAAHLTKTNVVGYVGGAEIPPTVHGANGFAAGVHSVDPKIKVLRNIVGDFNDVAKAKAATSAMITDNADVIFPFLDAGIAGSYAAGKASGKNPAMFKLTIPDCTSYGNIVGTEVVNNLAATELMLDRYAKGTLKAGAVFLDLQDPNLQTLKLCPKYQKNAEIAKVTKETIDGVNDGSIKLPANAINARPDYPYQEGFDGEVKNADKTG